VFAQDQAVYYIDPATGRVLKGEIWNSTTRVTGHLDMNAPGRPTTQQPIDEQNQPVEYTKFEVEYIQ
jgi:hypothetical protein